MKTIFEGAQVVFRSCSPARRSRSFINFEIIKALCDDKNKCTTTTASTTTAATIASFFTITSVA
ncbi:hypothetical protein E2C01_062252 [Portunus trituberculatus]|uniref:Uncharacterized protein n=1 Tax=Portunus trituberculatus TaxID=210409 RepID=A0A5B7HAG0_PORTR|nr:hypothetical protein [Portunus trituberculatus]